MTLLALDASGPRAGLAVLAAEGATLGRWSAPLQPGLIETLPLLLREAVAEHVPTTLAVCTGPGSFTGLRTSIALAQGFAAALGLPLRGIPAADAYAQGLTFAGRALWVVLRARRGRLFLLRAGQAEAWADTALPMPARPIALAGDEAPLAAAILAARGADVLLSDARRADPAWVGRAALAEIAAKRAPAPPLPLYLEPPEAKLPAAGLSPPPG